MGVRIGDAVRKFMETGFAHDDRARVAEPGDDRRVLVRHGVKAPVGTRCGRHPGDVDEIFDGHRDTGQGAGRAARAEGVVDTLRGVQRLVGHHVKKAIQQAIMDGNVLQECLGDFNRGDRSAGDATGDLRGGRKPQVFHRYGGVNVMAGGRSSSGSMRSRPASARRRRTSGRTAVNRSGENSYPRVRAITSSCSRLSVAGSFRSIISGSRIRAYATPSFSRSAIASTTRAHSSGVL